MLNFVYTAGIDNMRHEAPRSGAIFCYEVTKSGLRYFRRGESNKADKMYIQKNDYFNNTIDFRAKNIVKCVYTKCIYKKGEKT